MGLGGEPAEGLCKTIERIRNEKDKGKLTDYQRQLLQWSDNVDRRYAWVVLVAAWLMMAASFGTYRVYGLFFSKIVEEGYYTREEAAWPVAMILTMQTLSAPLVSVLNYYISARQCMLIGSLLLMLGNGQTAFNTNVVADTLMLGVVQGIGFGCVFVPLLEVMNSYFLKYRGLAFGIAMSGGTVAVFVLEPLIKWILNEYSWRAGYLALAGVCCLALVSAPLLKPNPQPVLPPPQPINETRAQLQQKSSDLSMKSEVADSEDNQVVASVSKSSFNISLVWSILKTPAFHFTWYLELLFYWVFSIYALVLVDYGKDRGSSKEEAEFLLQFHSVGELIGRILLPAFLDMGPLSTRHMVILNFAMMSAMLVGGTQVSGYPLLATFTICITANCAFINILVSKLLTKHLGEHQVTLGFGMASFICGVLMILRPQVVGFFRDQMGSYDHLMLFLSVACALAAVLWIIEPLVTRMSSIEQVAER